MRLFIALELPPSMQVALEEELSILKRTLKGRFVDPSTLHVTLAFMGEQDPESVGACATALDRAISRWHEADPWPKGPIDSELGGVGFFGKPRSATLWRGFEDPEPFHELGGFVRDSLAEEGIWFDPKPMQAHVTLARRVDLRDVDQRVLGRGAVPASGAICTATLFRSETLSGRVVYTPLESFGLE